MVALVHRMFVKVFEGTVNLEAFHSGL